MGILYVTATPIGNLEDMSFRAVKTLESVDFICAEDTRVSAKLLKYFEIKKPLVSYHEHNAREAGERIISRLVGGESAAIITDAGMPCISDPGELLVKLCAENGVEVRAVPGACAVVSALAVSGLDTNGFYFVGFLPTQERLLKNKLASVCALDVTLVFYEAPHRLKRTLERLYEFLGERKISLCRELTKLHEEVIRTTISQAIKLYSDSEPRGEFVLVVEGAQHSPDSEDTPEAALERVKALVNKGMRPADACREIARVSRFSKGELYSLLLEKNDG
ncbi:MAG: 16S rRNA (cytidine(1402)-2'-O)-methyltransferase [Ruminococcus sp.]|nr:16S rRNA (cytidine(1402)-2'-O)-methyltransferase [Ruminococcus sp.]